MSMMGRRLSRAVIHYEKNSEKKELREELSLHQRAVAHLPSGAFLASENASLAVL
jgi:hypothetical protein